MKENKGETTDAEFWKNIYGNANCHWDYYDKRRAGNGGNDLDYNSNTRKAKREHEFSPILLVYTTCYDCKHCKRKKEDCKTNYCSDEDNPPEWDLGGW